MAGDIAVCALLILFCLFCLFNLMFGMGNVMEYDPMGPRAWPVFLLVLLIALLALNIFLSLRAARRQTAAGEAARTESSGGGEETSKAGLVGPWDVRLHYADGQDRLCMFHAAVCCLLYDAAGEPQLEDAAFDRSSVHGRAVHPVFAVFAGAASKRIRNVPGSVAVL